MGRLTDALKKAAEKRLDRIDKAVRLQEQSTFIVRRVGSSQVDPRLVAYFDSKAVVTEQYKVLRTNVLALNKGKPHKVLAITSAIHSEGKTITALNLAISMAHATKKPKVLLLDADMRRGRVAKYLGVDHKTGLSNVLKGEASLEEAVFSIDIENLAFMPSGPVPENPAELLDSDRMRRLLSDLRLKYDHVLIDTPPIISVTDSGLIGSQTEGVLMVIQAGRTQKGIVRRATELLQQSHCNIAGYILTNVETHLPEYIYRYL